LKVIYIQKLLVQLIIPNYLGMQKFAVTTEILKIDGKLLAKN
jgi:hypothetical protein